MPWMMLIKTLLYWIHAWQFVSWTNLIFKHTNKTGKVYSGRQKIPEVFILQYRWRCQQDAYLTIRLEETVDSDDSYSKLTKATMVSKVSVTSTKSLLWANNDHGSHCCNWLTAWRQNPKVTMCPILTLVPTVVTMYSNNDICSHCCNNVFHICPSHAGFIAPRENMTDRHAWAHKVFLTHTSVKNI